jgi:aspartate/methionine/tyrosine aminotransferase
MSKEVSGTGMRLGFIAGPEYIMKVIAKVAGQTSACVNTPTQFGFEALLRGDKDMKIRKAIRDQFYERRTLLLSHFQNGMK